VTTVHLRVTVRFLQPYYHGRGEDGRPEWPPSPLRLFQALVASGLGREIIERRRDEAAAALRFLEDLSPPEIIAPPAVAMTPYRLFVPDNIGDRVAKSWAAGRDAELAEYRTEKDVRSVRLGGEAVHYVFRAADAADVHLPVIRRMARSLTHLGWGIDMVAGDAEIASGELDGEAWLPGRLGGTSLRLPIAGTLEALVRKHGEFLRRLEGDTFRPVSPLTTFDTQPYARATDVEPRAFAAYRLLDPMTGDPLWLDPTRRSRDVAAWTRHAVGELAASWPYGSADALVHGHGGPSETGHRFSYLPLPTLNPRLRRIEGIRRVLVVASRGLEPPLQWIRKRLGGHELRWHDKIVAVLEPLPAEDWVLKQYVGVSTTWVTVAPVVLPGHDDRSERKAEALLRKAFVQAGFERAVVDAITQLEWRKVGFESGTAHADRYLCPDKVRGPMFHVRVRFGSPVSGPISIGSGRHRGLGVFVTSDRG
jgi:CRISPR-associated protein Csb2